MKFIAQSIPDVILIKPSVHSDGRGYFLETYQQEVFKNGIGYDVNFIQDNESVSFKGVLRGLHYQTPPFAQAKLVRVIHGVVLDVVVDIRKSSLTFGKYIAVELTCDNKHQLFIPHGFAHGFVVLSDKVTFAYKVDNYYSSENDRGIAFDDEKIKIDWKLSKKELVLSDKDKNHPPLALAKDLFD